MRTAQVLALPDTDRLSAHITLAPGFVVNDRYEIEGVLGQGGAGAVYSATDRQLDLTIALKVLHLAFEGDQTSFARLKRETLLARSVTHVNVCRTFDLGSGPVRTALGDQHGSIRFMTMELLEGQTLSEIVQTRGPLEPTEALNLIKDVATGLSAAHEVGIVHGDVKTSNIILVADENPRAVVTDFGLAIESHTEPDALEAQGAGQRSPSPIGGTPAFVSPEQLDGQPLAPTSDIYSMGVVLYNLVTAKWPFSGRTKLDMALARTMREPEPPSAHRPTLDRRVEELILKCLNRDASKRPQTADDFLSTVSHLIASSQQPRAANRGRKLLGVLAVLAGLGLLGWLATSKGENEIPAPSSFTQATNVRPSLAVFGFWPTRKGSGAATNSRSEGTWVGDALSQSLAAELRRGEQIQVFGRESLAPVWRDLGLDPDQPPQLTAPELNALIERLGVDYLAVGHFDLQESEPEAEVRVKLQIFPKLGASSLFELSSSAPVGELADVASDLTKATETALGVQPSSTSAPTGPAGQPSGAGGRSIPQNPEAFRLLVQGRRRLARNDPTTARNLFDQALALEPDHPILLRELANALDNMGRTEDSIAAAEAAFRASEALSREERLAVEARYRLALREWERAEEIYRALWEFFPDDFRYGLALAQTQDRAARLDASVATLNELRARSTNELAIANVDFTEALVEFHRGNARRCTELARDAASWARQSSAKSLEAKALDLMALGMARAEQGSDDVIEVLKRSQSLFRELGDRSGLGGVQLKLGSHLAGAGDLTGAEPYFREALGTALEIGDRRLTARSQSGLARLLDQRGRLKEGLALKKDVQENYRDRSVRQGLAINTENIGISLFKLGRVREALAQFNEAEKLYEELGDQIGLAWSPYHLGRTWFLMGEPELAERSFARAAQVAEQIEDPELLTHISFERAILGFDENQPNDALQLAIAARGRYLERQQAGFVGEADLLIARLHLANLNLDLAQVAATEALEHSTEEGAVHMQASALTLLLRGALLAGDIESVESHSASLKVLLPRVEHGEPRLSAHLRLIHAAASGDDLNLLEAREELRNLASEAETLGLVGTQIQALWLEHRLTDDPHQLERQTQTLRELAQSAGSRRWAERIQGAGYSQRTPHD